MPCTSGVPLWHYAIGTPKDQGIRCCFLKTCPSNLTLALNLDLYSVVSKANVTHKTFEEQKYVK